MKGFHSNLAQTYVMQISIAEKIFEVKDQSLDQTIVSNDIFFVSLCTYISSRCYY